jgi:hypothetical protein
VTNLKFLDEASAYYRLSIMYVKKLQAVLPEQHSASIESCCGY